LGSKGGVGVYGLSVLSKRASPNYKLRKALVKKEKGRSRTETPVTLQPVE